MELKDILKVLVEDEQECPQCGPVRLTDVWPKLIDERAMRWFGWCPKCGGLVQTKAIPY